MNYLENLTIFSCIFLCIFTSIGETRKYPLTSEKFLNLTKENEVNYDVAKTTNFAAASAPEVATEGTLSSLAAAAGTAVPFHEKKEISLILFYTSWSGKCQNILKMYEILANLYPKEIHFVQMNCWDNLEKCSFYTKRLKWPKLVAFYAYSGQVEYHGPWSMSSLRRFINSLLNPMERIIDERSLLKMKITSDAVVVAFLENVKTERLFTFHRTAVKWLANQYTNLNVKFALVTGETKNFLNSRAPFMSSSSSSLLSPAIGLYLWNETKFCNFEEDKTVKNITLWMQNHLLSPLTWVQLRRIKSTSFISSLQKNPSIFIFASREAELNWTLAHLVGKQLSIAHKSCGKLPFLNDVHRFLKLNSIKRKEMNMNCKNNEKFCFIDADELPIKEDEEIINHWTDGEGESPSVGKSTIIDVKISDIIKRQRTEYRKEFSMFETVQEFYYQTDPTEIPEDIHKCNGNLSFYLLDSNLYRDLLTKIGISNMRIDDKIGVFAIDVRNESIYMMNETFSIHSLENFILKFNSNNLLRYQQRKKLVATRNAFPENEFAAAEKDNKNNANGKGKRVSIEEINSRKFREIIKYSKENTIVILFYSSKCALCYVISRKLLKLSEKLKYMNIGFYRIDGDRNDLPWEYTMGSYPSLIIFPRHRRKETRLFPETFKFSEKNFLGILLSSLTPFEKLRVLASICDNPSEISSNINNAIVNPSAIIASLSSNVTANKNVTKNCNYKAATTTDIYRNCVSILRKELLKSISDLLRYWRLVPAWQEEILNGLEKLQKSYNLVMEDKYPLKDLINLLHGDFNDYI